MSDIYSRIFGPFDSYSRTARLTPALLLIAAPIIVLTSVGVSTWPLARTLLAVFISLGIPLLLMDWVRRRGQGLQKKLWQKWGGNPVISHLRDDGLIPRKRRKLLADQTSLPLNDPVHPEWEPAMDNAIRRLISATRNRSQYPLVFAENKNYGFARNMLAVRSIGIYASIIALLISIILIAISCVSPTFSTLSILLGTLCCAALLLVWLFFPTESRVYAAAVDYRDRLLDALDAGALTDA